MERVKVSKIAKQIRGVSYKPEDLHDVLDDNSVTLLRANNIQDGKVDFEDVLYVDKSKVSQVQYLQKGDILVCASSGSKSIVGKAASIDFDGEYTFGAFCKVVRPIPDMIDYLGVYFQSQIYRDIISKAAMGANINNIRNEHIDNLEIPEKTSKEISSIIQRIKLLQYIIDRRNLELQKLDELVKARFVEMFGDPMINSMHWPIYELSEYIQFLTSGSRGWAKYFTDEGEYFITIKNVKNCKITLDDVQHIAPPDNAEAKRTKVQAGDLLISITADLGRTGVVTQEIAEHGSYINQHLTCIRLNQSVVLPLYVAYYMESDAGKKQFQLKNQTGVKAGLNFNSINTLKVMVPPLEKQRSFVSFVEQVEKTKSSIQKNLKKIEILKKALVQRYFG